MHFVFKRANVLLFPAIPFFVAFAYSLLCSLRRMPRIYEGIIEIGRYVAMLMCLCVPTTSELPLSDVTL